MLKLSVIIPVYNAEKFIVRSIKSVFDQGLPEDEFEIIAVNDGSKDNSLEVANNVAARYSNVKVIDQENKGEGGARNTALDVAQGKYILCLDADDSLVPNSIGELLDFSIENDIEICFYGGVNVYEDGRKEEIDLIHNVDKAGVIMTGQDAIALYKFHHSVCLSLFKREYIENNQARFTKNIWGTDVRFLTPLMLRARRVYRSPKICYNYVMFNPAAVTNNKAKDKSHFIKVGLSRIDVCTSLMDRIKKGNVQKDCLKVLISDLRLFSFYGVIKLMQGGINKTELLITFENLKNKGLYPFRKIYLNTNWKQQVIFHFMNTRLGINCAYRYYNR